jgi:hypothetical protein
MAVTPTAQNAGCTNAVNLKGQGQLARGAGWLAITAPPPADTAAGQPLPTPRQLLALGQAYAGGLDQGSGP